MLSRWKLSYRISLLVALNFVFLAAIAWLTTQRLDAIGAELIEIAEYEVPVTSSLADAAQLQLRQIHELEAARFAAAIVNPEAFESARSRFESLEEELASSLEDARRVSEVARSEAGAATRREFGEVLEALDEIDREHAQFLRDARALLDEIEAGGAGSESLQAETDQTEAALTDSLLALEHRVAAFTEQAARQAEASERELRNLLLTLLGIALVLGLVLGVVITRGITGDLESSSSDLGAVSAQMLASVQEQSASTSETASSVSETTTTLDELRQTAESATERASSVAEVAEHSLSSSEEAQRQVRRGVEVMLSIRDEVEGIARDILELSERNLQIGEIVQSVNAIAEQSNLLAVNASIEAAKAGEHGRGFSVVATEVRALAEQSKEATQQIRSILAETQKASNSAVMVTEQGTKRVAEGVDLIEKIGAVVDALAEAVEESADSARAIAMTANQQLAGIEQISSAMTNIEQATRDNAAGAAQLEQAATSVSDVSRRLVEVIEGRNG